MMACVYVTSSETLWVLCLNHFLKVLGSTATQVILQILIIFFSKHQSFSHSFLLFPFPVTSLFRMFSRKHWKQKNVSLGTSYKWTEKICRGIAFWNGLFRHNHWLKKKPTKPNQTSRFPDTWKLQAALNRMRTEIPTGDLSLTEKSGLFFFFLFFLCLCGNISGLWKALYIIENIIFTVPSVLQASNKTT